MWIPLVQFNLRQVWGMVWRAMKALGVDMDSHPARVVGF